MMFYRQKILLALLETSGPNLLNTDLEKLLFLFCQETKQNHYDFFPYKYGAFSFMSYYDKRKLTELGLLKDVKHFELNIQPTSYLNQLHVKDRMAMRLFSTKMKMERGKQLVRKTYLAYPEYALKSQILDATLSKEEQKSLEHILNNNEKQTLFTIGYEGSTVDHYLHRLIRNNVKVLIDVRKNPFSHKHGFSGTHLHNYLEKIDILYFHMPELGIPSNLRKNLTNNESYEALFTLYASEILPLQTEALNKIKKILHQYNRVGLTCFEANPCMCHRHKIVERIQTNPAFNIPIAHI